MPKNLKPDDIAAFRAELCRVAERRFARLGYAGVTMRQLAADLGCSPKTPYRYFADKDEILASLRAAAFGRFAKALEEAYATPGDVRRKTRAFGQAYLNFAIAEPDAYRLMFDLMQPNEERFPELQNASERARRALMSQVEILIDAGLMTGEPRTLGYAIWAAVHGVVVLHLAGKIDPAIGYEEVHRTLMRFLLRGAREDAAARTGPEAEAGLPRRRSR